MVRPCSCPPASDAEMGRVSNGAPHVQQINPTVTTMGIDISKNSFHVVGAETICKNPASNWQCVAASFGN
jgi:hypothetical protein